MLFLRYLYSNAHSIEIHAEGVADGLRFQGRGLPEIVPYHSRALIPLYRETPFPKVLYSGYRSVEVDRIPPIELP